MTEEGAEKELVLGTAQAGAGVLGSEEARQGREQQVNVAEEIGKRYDLEVKAHTFYEDLLGEMTRELNSRHLAALNPHPRVELGLGLKGMKSWRAIAHLFFGGFAEDAEIVLRTLVDLVVDMKFISLDPNERAERFIDHQVVHRLRLFREGKQRRLVTGEAELARIEAQLGQEAAAVLKMRPEWEKLPRSWSSEDTATKVAAIKEPMFYLTFMMGSALTHPSVASLERYFSHSEDAVEARPDPRVPKEPRVFIDSCVYLHTLIDHLNDVLHLDLDERCKQSRDKVHELVLARYPNALKDIEEWRKR